MNILSAGHHFYIKGGSDRYLINLINLMNNNGHNAIPFVSSDPKNLSSEWKEYFPIGSDVNNLNLKSGLRALYSYQAKQKINGLLGALDFDIAHLHIYYAQLTSSILKPLKDNGIPIVQTLHDFKLACPMYSFYSRDHICENCGSGSYFNAIAKRCNRGSLIRSLGSVVEAYIARLKGSIDSIDHFIAVSDFQRKKLLEYQIVPEKKISTIHNFVDSNPRNLVKNDNGYVLYFGRIEKIKGLKTLMKAMAPLKNIPLYIVGEGALKERIENFKIKNSLNHIKFLGFKSGSDLEDLIKGASFTVLPSEVYELCPLSILESYAYGKPVIGADIGGIPELINDNEDGLLFEAGNFEDLREKIDKLYTNRSLIKSMGKSGFSKIQNEFSPALHYNQVMNIYESVQSN